MRRIIRAGARGVEVRISGKSTSQRARTQIFRAGIISKCGTPAIDGVDKGISQVVLKSGTIGIMVKIMPLDYQLPDEIVLKDPELKARLEQHRKKQKKIQDEVDDGDVIIDVDSKKVVLDAGEDDEEEEEDFFQEAEDLEEIETIEVIPEDESKEEAPEKHKEKAVEEPKEEKKKRTRRKRKKKGEEEEES
jgi:hypothetical protein